MRMKIKHILIFFLLLILLAGCATALPETREVTKPTIIETIVVEKEGPTVISTRAASATPGKPEETLSPAMPTAEIHRVELEYPQSMQLGESGVIRLSLSLAGDQVQVQAEFSDNTVSTQTIPITLHEGYRRLASARLDGASFDITPPGDQLQDLLADQPVSWRWSFKPTASGRQRMVISLMLIWQPEAGNPEPEIRSQILSQGIEIQVQSFFGFTNQQAAAGGIVCLFFLFFLGVIAFFLLKTSSGHQLIRILTPNPALIIEPPAGLQLEPEETAMLQTIFNHHRRVLLLNEFLSGYSGARTFLAQPVQPDGQRDAATIVKIGSRSDIEREAKNYLAFVKDRLPPVTARIQHAPVSRSGSGRAAIQYTFIAEPEHLPISLGQALQQNPDPALLGKLFETFAPGWWLQKQPCTFRLGQEYDRLLPPHFVLQPVATNRHSNRHLNEKAALSGLALPLQDEIVVGPFRRIEPRADGASWTLYGPDSPGQAPMRLRWLSPQLPKHTPALVVADRSQLLSQSVAGFDRFSLPDPLPALPALLEKVIEGTQSIIHGDLNLENALLGPGGLVWLIDFSETRTGHTLFDFAHLSAELVVHIYARQFSSPLDFLKQVQDGQLGLLNALDNIALRCLFHPLHPQEWQTALLLSYLGTLRYRHINSHARHLAYLYACHIFQQLKD